MLKLFKEIINTPAFIRSIRVHMNRKIQHKNMKKIILITFITLLFSSIIGCEDNQYVTYTLATPVIMPLDEFRNSVVITSPKEIVESGKIYVYQDYIFVNDKYKGIHVIDNSNPVTPVKMAFISIFGNVDISVKGNYLYADSLMDLVVFDISDIGNITEVGRLIDVFTEHHMVSIPVDADYYDFENYDAEGIIVDWELTVEQIRYGEELPYNLVWWGTDIGFADAMSEGVPTTGQGGSLARFKIVEDYLYAVDSQRIHMFNIQNLADTITQGNIHAGFGIETIFNRGDYVFLGSRSGMYIYDISQANSPAYVSEFNYATACDPVVVEGNYAYITLRGGNSCGVPESVLEIVDISDIHHPELLKSYLMDNPYGLGIKNDLLFICDGTSGLKVFDKSDINNLQLIDTYEEMNAFDVIPLESHLVMIADNRIYQFNYLNETIELPSDFPLN